MKRLAAAAERDPQLVEWALGQRVVLATPSTLFALLRAIELLGEQALATGILQRFVEDLVACGRERVDRGRKFATRRSFDAVGEIMGLREGEGRAARADTDCFRF